MKVLITGAGGFTARHLVPRLRQESQLSVVGTDCRAPEVPWDGVDEFFQADLSDFQQVSALIGRLKPAWVINLAGLLKGSLTDLYRANLLAALNLLDAVRINAPNTAVLLVGSAAEYGIWPSQDMPLAEEHVCRPVGAYGGAKHAMTLAALDFARLHGLRVLVVRPFNLLGAGLPTSLVAGAIARRAKDALAQGVSTISVGNINSQRDFVAVEDAVDAYVRLLQRECWGEVVNICSGRPRSIREIVEQMLSFCPTPITAIENTELVRSEDANVVVGDPRKAQRLCDFVPRVAFYDALRAVWDASTGDSSLPHVPSKSHATNR